MSGKTIKGYETPEVTEYGTVESITQNQNKVGSGDDEYSEITPLVGSVVDA
ncbi:lasso RiPP family leader peptide-containing protein [Halobacteria archaeon AArc-m2/3/4]|uniref:Lasso RiPP family leader peptide-containing protein n=1 Tax=Natronoglomus mannanivorans TaxID=2979990 RepID=A0AAP2Z2A1_9EURY|nr:lasso RiPP family leader peptide-containing protein [Halobacteria archaeon AArc-xg1-1]MCU4974875.1 lasso RiPP family leader peptide-containing protein [Halobacteria archaeon AArc-m2/3/4]